MTAIDAPDAAAIRRAAAALGVPCDARGAELLVAYAALLLRWNKRTNLVRLRERSDLLDRHLGDAMAVLRLLDRPEVAEQAPAWHDVGSGPGLPGLVVACLRPALRVTMVEPIGKKVAFVRQAIATLGLENASIVQARLGDLPAAPGTRAAMSRATFAPGEWLDLAAPFVGPGGLVLAMLARKQPAALRERAWLVDDLRLPISGVPRTNLIVRVG